VSSFGEDYEVHVGVRVECAEPGCHRIITNYAIRKDAPDRRVWCLRHEARAWEAGRAAEGRRP
jgi:hypothetical protein